MSNEVAVLGVGMHPWGKWGRNFVEYGVHAIHDALADSGLDYRQIEFIAGGDTMRNGYPGYVSAATFAKAMGWTGIPVASCYAACASGATAMEIAVAWFSENTPVNKNFVPIPVFIHKLNFYLFINFYS